jgi:hypothetical protein
LCLAALREAAAMLTSLKAELLSRALLISMLRAQRDDARATIARLRGRGAVRGARAAGRPVHDSTKR